MIYVFYLMTSRQAGPVLYAWTSNKSTANTFKKSRCMKKFIYKKFKNDEFVIDVRNESKELSIHTIGVNKGVSIVDIDVVMTNAESFQLQMFLEAIDDVISMKLKHGGASEIKNKLTNKYKKVFDSIENDYDNYGDMYVIDEFYAFSYIFGYTLFEDIKEMVYDPVSSFSSSDIFYILDKLTLPF